MATRIKGDRELPYTLEDCTCWYKNTKDIQQSYGHVSDVYIMVEHQQAVPVWGTYASKNSKPLMLITLDYHCDTWPVGIDADVGDPEWQEMKDVLKIERRTFIFEHSYKATCEVSNRKQIKFAHYCGYINRAFIFARDGSPKSFHDNYEEVDQKNGYNFIYRYVDDDNKADLDVLNGVAEDFILDIDLDFFVKPFNFNSELGVRMRKLMKEAKVITIAREPYYFEECKGDAAFTNEMALDDLIMAIKEVRGMDEGSGE